MTALRTFRCLCAVSLLAGAAPALAENYYVATNGDDDVNDGLAVDRPFRTIQQAADLVRAGDTVYIRGGAYREGVVVTNYGTAGQYITFCAYTNERPVIKGSDVVTNWLWHTNFIWKNTNGLMETQQVFDDGVFLRQVGMPKTMTPEKYTPFGSNLQDMVAGSFFYETNSQRLYVWLADNSNPNASEMEVSRWLYLFCTNNASTSSYFHVKGLAFRHSNTVTYTNGWPAVWSGGRSLVEDCDIQWCDFAGLSLGQSARAIRCNLSNNGDNGGSSGEDGFFSQCTVLSNNYRGFNTGWHAGGIKINIFGGTIEYCEVGWNKGVGIWFDYCRTGLPLIIRNNYIHHNENGGIMLEVSQGGEVYNNLIVSNGVRGIYFSSASSNEVYNNTIVGSRDWVGVDMQYVATRTNEEGNPFQLRDNRFCNNIVYDSRGPIDLALWEPDGSNVLENISDYNCYFRPAGALNLNYCRHGKVSLAFTNASDFFAATGFEEHSLCADPRFLDADRGDFHLKSQAGTWSNGSWVLCDVTSPCVDAGDPASDYRQEPRWHGGRANMGTYGNTAQASRSPDPLGEGNTNAPRIRVIGATQNWASVRWYAFPEYLYWLDSITDLVWGSWSLETQMVDQVGQTTGSVTGQDSWIMLMDTGTPGILRKYYRLRASSSP